MRLAKEGVDFNSYRYFLLASHPLSRDFHLAHQSVSAKLAVMPCRPFFQSLVVSALTSMLHILPVASQTPEPLEVSVADVPIDFGFLNEKPAGLRGPVRAQGADLVFADGTPIKFWGANIQANAIFSTKSTIICQHAKRLAALGFNLVRLHHHDSDWVRPNVFLHNATNNLSLNPIALDRIGQWVACLKAQGIYTWLDLHVGRRMSAADEISFANEIEKTEGDIRGFNFVNETIRDRMAEFQTAYLSHVNPHTGLSFKNDPAVAVVMISNENDLTYHFANRLLPTKNVPRHSARYMELAEEFAVSNDINPEHVWRSWEHGLPKKFLNDLERQFFAPLAAEIRDLGYEGLIATSSIWGKMGASALPSLTVGDIIDVHSYGKPGIARTDPATDADMISVIAGAQVAGKPLSISEWNITPWPEPDRFLAPLRMGAAAAHQGWDAPIIYGYAQRALGTKQVAHNWHIAEDASLVGPLAVAALLFRRSDVARASRVVAITPDVEALFGAHRHAETSPAIRALAERSRLITRLPEIKALPWFRPSTENTDQEFQDYNATPLGTDARPILSDTGEIRRDPEEGIIWIETDRSLVVAGNLGVSPQEVGGLRLSLDRPLAGVALQSLDGARIAESEDLLVTVMGPSRPVETRRPPFLVEQVTGTIEFVAKPGLLAHGAVMGEGHGKVSHYNEDGVHRLILNGTASIFWIRLRSP